MEEKKLKAEVREKSGVKGFLSGLRRSRKIPAVVYGGGKDPLKITVNQKDLEGLIKMGSNVIINMELGGKSEKVILKEVSHHVVDSSILHADFQRIAMDRKIEISVPVVMSGVAPGVKTHGALLEHVTRQVGVRCLPADIPHEIMVDVSGLADIGSSVTVADLLVPQGVEIAEEAGAMVAHLLKPKEELVEVAGPAEEIAEPEVAEKGRKEEAEVKEETGKEKAKEEPKKEKK
jgi:large subunit ribosomal protein L25